MDPQSRNTGEIKMKMTIKYRKKGEETYITEATLTEDDDPCKLFLRRIARCPYK
jgi:hypothetical protein